MWHFYKRQNDFLFASDKEIDYEDIRRLLNPSTNMQTLDSACSNTIDNLYIDSF